MRLGYDPDQGNAGARGEEGGARVRTCKLTTHVRLGYDYSDMTRIWPVPVFKCIWTTRIRLGSDSDVPDITRKILGCDSDATRI
jgi:hypothetical protein